MADLQKTRLALMALVKELDPDVECNIAAKAVQGSYVMTLTRGGEEQMVKVSEKELSSFENDEKLRQKIEERVLTAIDELPGGFDAEEDSEEEDFDEEDMEEGEDEDFEEDEDDDAEEEEEEEAGDDDR
jgi:hypothetical protein